MPHFSNGSTWNLIKKINKISLPQFLNCSTWNLSNVKNKFYRNNFQTNFVISLSWQSWSRLSKRQICRLCSICVPEKLFSIPQTQTLFLHILGTFWTSYLAFTSRGRKVNVQYIVVSATHSGKWTVFHSSRFFYFFYGKKNWISKEVFFLPK